MSATNSPMSRKSWAARRGVEKPKPISGSQLDWIVATPRDPEYPLPLVIEPRMKSVDLGAWVANHRDWLDQELHRYGGILFRGFGLAVQSDFELFLRPYADELLHYREGATPRSDRGHNIYTSTEFPPEETIALHNELSYVNTWPMKIWFFCTQPPATGGETPIADMRRVYRRLSPETIERFAGQGWQLVRNLGYGFGPGWRSAYRVETREEAVRYFREAEIEFEWKEGDRLRTRQVRPAIASHPRTKETVWFNHAAFWHVSSLKPELRRMFTQEFGEDGLPYSTYYGDGSRIEEPVAEELREAYRAETVLFSWQRGDVLMLDNMLVAHGRNPFTGPREILVAMGEPCHRREALAS